MPKIPRYDRLISIASDILALIKTKLETQGIILKAAWLIWHVTVHSMEVTQWAGSQYATEVSTRMNMEN